MACVLQQLLFHEIELRLDVVDLHGELVRGTYRMETCRLYCGGGGRAIQDQFLDDPVECLFDLLALLRPGAV